MSWTLVRPRILLFGDSLTEKSFDSGGWAARLSHSYARRADVVARGFGGYNTTLAQFLVDSVLSDATPSNTLLMALFFGANDAAMPMPLGTQHSSRQHCPVDQYTDNLRAIVVAARARGLKRMLLITPPPVYEPGRKAHQRAKMGDAAAEGMNLDRANAYTRQYADACAALAAEEGLPCADLWGGMQAGCSEGGDAWGPRLFTDGLHFTPAGQGVCADIVQAAIERAYPEAAPASLPLHAPPWEAYDARPLASAFCHPPSNP
ncbi:hypothetical protein FOA52_015595 [Chlamydomonas sp. UWO 241]|nr:hypothetical protein FOA52_015595 [Chlamydomonas sp. UWO 241]